MTWVYVVAEGECEWQFLTQVVAPDLASHGVWLEARQVATSRHRSRVYRGGLVDYGHLRREVGRWMNEKKGDRDCRFSTFVDLYAHAGVVFPGLEELRAWERGTAQRFPPDEKVARIEAAMAADMGDDRFIPYLQVHEFETFLFVAPEALACSTDLATETVIASLQEIKAAFPGPEWINDGVATAPSKRIIQHLPVYEGSKTRIGPDAARVIGLSALELGCPHFGAWMAKLRKLGTHALR